MCPTCSLSLRSHLSARRRNISYDSSVFTAGMRAPPLEKGDPPCRCRSRDDGSCPTGDLKSDVDSDLTVETQNARSEIARALEEGLSHAWAPADDRVPPPPPTRKRREWGRIDIGEKVSGRCEGSCCKVWQSNPLRVIAPKQLVWGQIQLHFFSIAFS